MGAISRECFFMMNLEPFRSSKILVENPLKIIF